MARCCTSWATGADMKCRSRRSAGARRHMSRPSPPRLETDHMTTPAPGAEPRSVDVRPLSGPAISGLLPTTVVGSYSVPEWLERLKTDCYQRRISGTYLQEIHEVAIKAALKDQEQAGVDIVSDGELRRDNDVDYFLARMPGVEIPNLAKTFYYDYYEAVVRRPIPEEAT